MLLPKKLRKTPFDLCPAAVNRNALPSTILDEYNLRWLF